MIISPSVISPINKVWVSNSTSFTVLSVIYAHESSTIARLFTVLYLILSNLFLSLPDEKPNIEIISLFDFSDRIDIANPLFFFDYFICIICVIYSHGNQVMR